MIGCKWVGASLDSSGYASASRSYIDALMKHTDINLTLDVVSFEQEHTDHGAIQKAITPLIGKKIPYDVKICHCTPENFPALREPGIYNIGYVAWETSRLPRGWADLCNLMDEIWVPSTWNKDVFFFSGVDKPIRVIPHVIDAPDLSTIEHVSMGTEDNTYVFYSIFQWIERKNPAALLRAYLTEFKPDENVLLAMKSYRLNTSAEEQKRIKDEVAMIKRSLQMEEFPPIRFFGSLLTGNQMKSIQVRGDCFVLPTRAEGFGIPIAEAMVYGKPTITTNYGGATDFINNKNSFPIDCFEVPVSGMIFNNYNGWMNWAEPSIGHLKKLMRYCFENRDAARSVGEQAKKDILANYNGPLIAGLIKDRLVEIKG